jgi:hypothetical protein
MPYAVFSLGVRPSLKSVVYLHVLLSTFLLLAVILPTYSLAYPLFFGSSYELLVTEVLTTTEAPSLTLNSDLIESVVLFQVFSSYNFLSSWQIIYGPNVCLLNAYLLPFSNISLSNYYILQFNAPFLLYLTETYGTQALLFPLFTLSVVPYLGLLVLPVKEPQR